MPRVQTDGTACQAARIKAGLTIRGAAKTLNEQGQHFTPQHISQIENNLSGASPAKLNALANLYGVPVESLYRVPAGAA